jgi:hypothetical protein
VLARLDHCLLFARFCATRVSFVTGNERKILKKKSHREHGCLSCAVFVLSGRDLCDGPIPRPEESYRLWCVSESAKVKITTLYTCCDQAGRRGKTAKRKKTNH